MECAACGHWFDEHDLMTGECKFPGCDCVQYERSADA